MKKLFLMLLCGAMLVSFNACETEEPNNPSQGTDQTNDSKDDEQPTPTIDNNGYDYVDLGLPSGTLWAVCNVGASSPEEYGDYFAWGETIPKSDYS